MASVANRYSQEAPRSRKWRKRSRAVTSDLRKWFETCAWCSGKDRDGRARVTHSTPMEKHELATTIKKKKSAIVWERASPSLGRTQPRPILFTLIARSLEPYSAASELSASSRPSEFTQARSEARWGEEPIIKATSCVRWRLFRGRPPPRSIEGPRAMRVARFMGRRRGRGRLAAGAANATVTVHTHARVRELPLAHRIEDGGGCPPASVHKRIFLGSSLISIQTPRARARRRSLS